MAGLTEREIGQIEAANASGRRPVVFVHGLWLLASSWDRWAKAFEAAGYAPLTPGWPDDPETVAAARRDPEPLAGKGVGEVAAHFASVIEGLEHQPAIIGHSFGGLLAQMLAGRGLAVATVAVDPGPFRGILSLPPAALRWSVPLLANPANRGRAIALSVDQFRYSWANAVSEQEARELHQRFHVAAPAKPLFQAAVANLNPATELKVDARNPDRGPLLLFTGLQDHAVPPTWSRAAYRKQRRNPGITEHLELDRGHSLTIDSGWQEVCDRSLEFVARVTAD